jgi:hypothetical protein
MSYQAPRPPLATSPVGVPPRPPEQATEPRRRRPWRIVGSVIPFLLAAFGTAPGGRPVRPRTHHTPSEHVHAQARIARAERAADLARLRRATHTDVRGRIATALRGLAVRLDPLPVAPLDTDRRPAVATR